MEITWSTIGKIMLVGFGTYIFLPAILILRDWVLWKFIGAYILNDKLHKNIKELVIYTDIWNSSLAVDSKIDFKEGETTYLIKDKKVSKEEWSKHQIEADRIIKITKERRLYLDRMSNYLDWLLKHYKFEKTNPISHWLDRENERYKKRKAKKEISTS